MASDFSLSSLAAFALDLRLPIGLTLDEVELQTGEAKFVDKALILPEPGHVVVRISPESLQSFITPQLPGMIRYLKIVLKDGLIHATATAKLVVEVTATAMLKPEIVGGEELHLKVVDFEGPSIARGIMEKQLEQQNPVFRTSDVPFPIELKSVEVLGNLIIEGTWNLPLFEKPL